MLDGVGADAHVFIREGGPTSFTAANVYCVSTNLKCHLFVVFVAKYMWRFSTNDSERYFHMKGRIKVGRPLLQGLCHTA